jgi:hypothetical protein
MRRPELPIKELQKLQQDLQDKMIQMKFGNGRRARYKGKGLGDDLLNAAMPYVSKGLSTATNALKTSMHDVMGKIPGMDFFEHAMNL